MKFMKDSLLYSNKYTEAQKKINIFGICFFVTIFVTYFVLMYFTYITQISGTSMYPTLSDKSYAIMFKTKNVTYGDIVTIDATDKYDETENIIKRVIGLYGDELIFMYSENTYLDGHLTFDLYRRKANESHFVKVDEPYINERMYKNCSRVIHYNPKITEIDFSSDKWIADYSKLSLEYYSNVQKVDKQNYFFFLGDNRIFSNDSRGDYGLQPISKITGKLVSVRDEKDSWSTFLFNLYGIFK